MAVSSPEATAGVAPPRVVRWRLARRLAGACYVVVIVVCAFRVGVPLTRVSIVVWTLGGLAVCCLGRDWRMFRRALLDWLPFCAAMVCYDFSRGLADQLGLPVHSAWPAAADRALFGGRLPTVWLQKHFFTRGVVHWYDVAASLVYFSFFLAVPIVMAVLWVRNRRLWLRFTANVVTVSFFTLAIYVVFPEAPPWYAANQGVISRVDRISSLGWSDLGLRGATDLIEHGQAIANEVAAMPSLHAAYSTLVAVFFLRRVSGWVRPLLLAYPLAMGLALVYTGEHWVIDVIAGIGCTVAIFVALEAGARLLPTHPPRLLRIWLAEPAR